MRNSVLSVGVVLVAFTLLSCAQQQIPVAEKTVSNEADVEAVKAAVIDVYSKLNAADADALTKYLLPSGYSEFVEDGSGLVTLDLETLREVFAAGARTDLEVRDLKVKVLNDSAIVTGYRVGSITMPDQEPEEGTFCLSMMWVRESGQWRLGHVHLSPSRDVPSDSAAVRNVHDSFFEGLLREDTTIVDRILAPEVTLGFPGGNVTPRETFLGYLHSGDLFYDSADHHELNVRIYGDAAILTGQSTFRVRFQGTSFSERLTYTTAYVRSDIGWQMVAWQSTAPT